MICGCGEKRVVFDTKTEMTWKKQHAKFCKSMKLILEANPNPAPLGYKKKMKPEHKDGWSNTRSMKFEYDAPEVEDEEKEKEEEAPAPAPPAPAPAQADDDDWVKEYLFGQIFFSLFFVVERQNSKEEGIEDQESPHSACRNS